MAADSVANSICGLLDANAAQVPARLAVAGPRDQLSWKQLKIRSEAIASRLRAAGLVTGDRVCLWLPSSPSWVAAFLGLRRLGQTGVSIGNRARPAELRDLLQRFDASAVIAEADDTVSGEVCTSTGIPLIDLASPFSGPAGADTCREVPPAPGALVHLTSGSSGTPKGVLRVEADLVEEARNVALGLRLGSNDRMLCATPIYHSFASGLFMACLWSATPCILMDALSPATLLDLARRERATILAGVPYVFQLLTALSLSSEEPLSLRLGVSGGAPLRSETAVDFRERFGAPLVQEYGLSEAGIVTFNLAHPERVESAGAPIPNVSLRIADPADSARDLPPETAGEVLVCRAFAPTGYVGAPEESFATFTSHGVRTGDLGLIDADGCLTLTGRIKSMINVAGAKVAPREVEEVLLADPAVAAAIVFATPSAHLGETVAAVVVLREGAVSDEPSLIAHCRRYLSAYKVPAAVHIVVEFPRTQSGKLDVPRMQEAFRSGGSLGRLEVSL